MLCRPAAQTFSSTVKLFKHQNWLSKKCTQEQVSYEALKISHRFSMDHSGTQTCLQHENRVWIQWNGGMER